MAVVFTDTALMAATFGLLAALAALTGAFRHWYGTLRKALPFVALVVLASTLFPRISWGPVLFAADWWIFHPSVTPGGFVYSLGVGFRLLTAAGVSTLFIMTTRFEDFVAGLRKLHVPYVVAFSLGLALRSVTLMSADMKIIMDAQRSRCLELDAGGLLSRNRLMSLVMPMTICLINRSRNISSAMLCRGYGYSARPAIYSRLRPGPGDRVVVAGTLAGMAVLAFLYWRPL
ncbi:MAG: Energy-coupling factor transporter transmembrane protein EcfT [Methanocella sp. PtaU1.Bin125]|nr:MAG: Energy-coupling factor transporter transmembrane protein EcfT [Methanocella sp. PtaU1.Bin125]